MVTRAVKRGAKARATKGAKAAAAATSTEVEKTAKMEEETVKVEEETVTETKEEMKVEEVGIEEEKPSVEESEAESSVNAEDLSPLALSSQRATLCPASRSSAASAAAAVAAVNAIFGNPLDPLDLILAGLESEKRVSGYHADNIAPAILGGFVLVRNYNPFEIMPLVFPGDKDLFFVLVSPEFEAPTKKMREVLPGEIGMKDHIFNSSQAAALWRLVVGGDVRVWGVNGE
ncbi:uncharacterized protein A4U43_C01F10280 [Asparagus officinalis]|uniref:GHMP kinase N-terminal domain-containing protein n=1 Tax=Asparagus officinalis TaxID=4686 RepID=A0A5P1FNK2_ASPOF|nr:uncharacterized protein A4U43_C01F10280 [Asparagus officinalis]